MSSSVRLTERQAWQKHPHLRRSHAHFRRYTPSYHLRCLFSLLELGGIIGVCQLGTSASPSGSSALALFTSTIAFSTRIDWFIYLYIM